MRDVDVLEGFNTGVLDNKMSLIDSYVTLSRIKWAENRDKELNLAIRIAEWKLHALGIDPGLFDMEMDV